MLPGGPHRLLEETIPSSQTTVLLKNLQPGTPYAVTVLGENEIGQGQPSDVLKFVTGEEGLFTCLFLIVERNTR